MDIEELKQRLDACIETADWEGTRDSDTLREVSAALSQLQAENARLNDVIAKQASAARMGMDAAKKHASQMMEEATRLNAESKPEVIASERAANAILTAENAELRRDLEEMRKEVREWACDDCNTIYPGPPAEGLSCVICPKCKGRTAPRSKIDLIRARRELEEARKHPPAERFAIVIDRNYEGEGLSLAVHDGVNFMFSDGDCYDREGDTLDGYTAEFLTQYQLEKRLEEARKDAKKADDLYIRLESLSKALESSGQIDEHEYPDAYGTILDAMNIARQQQGG